MAGRTHVLNVLVRETAAERRHGVLAVGDLVDDRLDVDTAVKVLGERLELRGGSSGCASEGGKQRAVGRRRGERRFPFASTAKGQASANVRRVAAYLEGLLRHDDVLAARVARGAVAREDLLARGGVGRERRHGRHRQHASRDDGHRLHGEARGVERVGGGGDGQPAVQVGAAVSVVGRRGGSAAMAAAAISAAISHL